MSDFNKILEDYLKGIKPTSDTSFGNILTAFSKRTYPQPKPISNFGKILSNYLKPTVTATVGIGTPGKTPINLLEIPKYSGGVLRAANEQEIRLYDLPSVSSSFKVGLASIFGVTNNNFNSIYPDAPAPSTATLGKIAQISGSIISTVVSLKVLSPLIGAPIANALNKATQGIRLISPTLARFLINGTAAAATWAVKGGSQEFFKQVLDNKYSLKDIGIETLDASLFGYVQALTGASPSLTNRIISSTAGFGVKTMLSLLVRNGKITKDDIPAIATNMGIGAALALFSGTRTSEYLKRLDRGELGSSMFKTSIMTKNPDNPDLTDKEAGEIADLINKAYLFKIANPGNEDIGKVYSALYATYLLKGEEDYLVYLEGTGLSKDLIPPLKDTSGESLYKILLKTTTNGSGIQLLNMIQNTDSAGLPFIVPQEIAAKEISLSMKDQVKLIDDYVESGGFYPMNLNKEVATTLKQKLAEQGLRTPDAVFRVVSPTEVGGVAQVVSSSILKKTEKPVSEKVEVKPPETFYNKVTGKVTGKVGVPEVAKIKPTKEIPVKEVKPITSIKPVEILKTVPEVWKTENADVLVNKLDINQLRSLKSLFDKALAGNKLTVSEKSVITKNHIMELNKETNKYELTIGEYQGKFLYDTIRGKIVRLQMTQKEIPAEVKPVAKVAKEVKPEPKPEKAIQPTQPAEVPQKIRTFRFNGNIKTGEAIGNFGGKNNFKVGETIKIIGNDATRIGIVKTAGKGFWRIELTTPAEQAVTKVPEVKAEVAKEPTKVTLQRIIPNPRGDNEIKDIQLIKETSKSFKVWLPTEKKYQLIPKSEWQIKPEVAKVKEKVPIVKEEVKVAEKPVKVYGKADAHFVSKAVSGNNIDTPIKLTGRYLETVKGTKVEGLTQDSKSHWFFKKNILNPDEFSEYARWGALPDGKEVAVYYAGVEQFGKEFKVSQLNLPIGAETKSLTTEEITEHISKTIDPHEKVRKQLTSALKKMKLLKPKPNAKGVWVPSVDMQTIMKRYFPKETLNGILNSENETQTLMEIIDGMNKVKEATGEDVQLGRVGIASVVQSEWRTVQEVFGDYKLVDRTSYAGVKIIEYLNDANRSIQKLYKETINPVIKKYKINKADLFDILRHPERFPDLSQEVKDMAQKVITWNKVWQEDMADKLNIPLKYRIENHIFYQYEYLIREVLEDPQGDKSLPQSLLHGIADYKSSQPLAEFEDPALKKRTQEDGLGMIKDFYKATMSSLEYGIRKYYLDPILNDMKKVWGKLDLKTQVHFKRWISEDLVGKTPYMEGLIRESGGKLDRLLTANLKKIINPKTHQPIFKGEVKDAVEKLINVTISATYMAFLSLYPKTALLQFFQKTAVVPLVSGYGFTFATKNWLNPKYRRFVSQNSNVYKLRKVERLAGMEESTRNKFLRILQNVTMFLFNMFDTDGVTFAFIAGYGEAKHYGLSEEVSIARGEEVARQSMYIYTKMFRSELARNVLGRAASMFTSFPINFAGLMADLLKGNVSNVYKKHFKEHPEELTGNRGKLVKKNYAGLIKYLLMLIGASLLQKKTRVRVTKYIGIDALFGLFNYNAAAFNVYKYAGNALYYLLVDWDPKKALAEFNKLSPSDQISLLRTLQYLGVYGNKKDIWNAILYMNKLPTIKITTPPGRTTRKGER